MTVFTSTEKCCYTFNALRQFSNIKKIQIKKIHSYIKKGSPLLAVANVLLQMDLISPCFYLFKRFLHRPFLQPMFL